MRIAIACAMAACTAPQGPVPMIPASIVNCEQSSEPEPHACLDAGQYYESQQNIPRAVTMYGLGCKVRFMDACIAGSRYSPEMAVPACEAGYDPACLDAARFLDGDLPRRKVLLDGLCTRDAFKCADAAKILVERDEPSAVEIVRRACSGPQREACAASVRVAFRDPASQLEVGRLGCTIDVAEACVMAGTASSSPDERRELLTHACKLKSEAGCVALGRLISR